MEKYFHRDSGNSIANTVLQLLDQVSKLNLMITKQPQITIAEIYNF